MKPLRSPARACLLLSLSLLTLPALADDDCDAPIRQWQSRDAVLQMAAQQGWQVQRLKIDDGCYEIRGRDAQGQSFKAKIDPRTLGIVKMKRRDDDDDRDRRRARAAGPAAPRPCRADQPVLSSSWRRLARPDRISPSGKRAPP